MILKPDETLPSTHVHEKVMVIQKKQRVVEMISKNFNDSLFYYINVPVTDMREHPSHKAEIVSQALFSEQIQVLDRVEEWIKIETLIDKYRGWIKNTDIWERKNAFLADSSSAIEAKVSRYIGLLYEVQDTVYGPIMDLPFESRLEVIEPKEKSDSRWLKVRLLDETEGFIQRGDVELISKPLNREQMCQLSQRFLGLPYRWGGRSSFGYDCSGYVQMLYRQMGIYLPRDTKDQINWDGFNPIVLEKMSPGDLVYFGLSEDTIRHVGMYIGKDEFIHASVAENAPYIHTSNLLDDEWNGLGRFKYIAGRRLK